MIKKDREKKLLHHVDREKLIVTMWKIKNKREYIDLFKQDNKNTLV